MTDEARDLAYAIDGARLANSLPFIEAEIQKSIGAVVNRADSMARGQELTPDIALMLWHELLAHKRLLSRLTQQVKIGITAAQRQERLLTGDLPLPRL